LKKIGSKQKSGFLLGKVGDKVGFILRKKKLDLSPKTVLKKVIFTIKLLSRFSKKIKKKNKNKKIFLYFFYLKNDLRKPRINLFK